jgi:hypothetical protein
LLDGFLGKFGLTPATVKAGLTAAAREVANIGGDMLGATIEIKVVETVRPWLEDIRAQLLKNVIGDAPATFVVRIRSAYPSMNDEQIALLWLDVIAAVAETPSKAPTAEEAARS